MKPIVFQVVVPLLFLSLGLWLIVLRRRAIGLAILPVEKRHHVPWGLVDLLFAMTIAMVIQLGLQSYWGLSADDMAADSTSRKRILLLAASAISRGLTVTLSAALILMRHRANLRDLGIDVRKLGTDLKIGLVAFLMLAPLIYALQFVLVRWIPSQHPLVKWIAEDNGRQFFVMCCISAVIVAPIAEEYFFRLLLQGWMEKIADREAEPIELLLGRLPPAWARYVLSEQPYLSDKPAADKGATDKGATDKGPTDKGPTDKGPTDKGPTDKGATAGVAVWPVFVSALIFAFMHFSHGPDPIPLFFLAVAMGLLYRNTHRILPSIIVHMLLNGSSMLMLAAGMAEGG